MPNNIFDFRITHRNWQEAVASLFALLIAASPGEVVVVAGPSRCGKTRLIDHVCDLLFPDKSTFAGGKIPYVVVDAVNAGPNGSFSTKSFTLRMLAAIKHPFYSLDNADPEQISEYKLLKMDRSTESSLRIALERAFIIRGVLYLFIDEAQHASYATRGAMGAHAVLDSWKCFAKSTQIVLVIVGAYPILNILQNSPHMLGRKHQVHLPRYYSTEADIKEFVGILDAYEARLHMQGIKSDLRKDAKLLYGGSLGCIGLLRAWLMRAYAYAQIQDNSISEKLLLATKLPDSDLREIAIEIEHGELILNEDRPVWESQKHKSPIRDVKKKEKQKPFQRNPKRETEGNRSE
jgi:energy-coupling factor transporter ATP-binding protein EcfA2